MNNFRLFHRYSILCNFLEKCYIAVVSSQESMEKRSTIVPTPSDAFADFITGTGVKRQKLRLTLDGRDLTEQFLQELQLHDFVPSTVGNVDVSLGERVPAFYIEDSTAFFGWVFWEKFTETKARKLWGSVVRNKKGDWAIQIPPSKPTIIYANVSLKIEMDVERPE
jgi:hypothetical protein